MCDFMADYRYGIYRSVDASSFPLVGSPCNHSCKSSKTQSDILYLYLRVSLVEHTKSPAIPGMRSPFTETEPTELMSAFDACAGQSPILAGDA
jgi:hypothetical protein